MKYQELIKEVEGVGKLKLSEQKNFYRDVLNESSNDLVVGVAATLQIRKKDKKIPILAMSANAYMQDIQKCYQAGMNGHISKPLYLEDLKDRIIQIL
ncbi:response regulator [Holdemanella biformis]|uniref:Response regulator n=1 Tax=Holdemanella biformis TaxID=1735 RepID=A0A413U9R1_9FIRM|nr:response regulator [Holdemanella biformis]RHB00185.1 response regulator [Holdemanella biformis]